MLPLLAVATALLAIASSRDEGRESVRRSSTLSSSEGSRRKVRSSSPPLLPAHAPSDLDPDEYARVATMSDGELYDLVVDLILRNMSKWAAFTHQDVLESQYQKYRTTVRAELGFGPRSRAEVEEGIKLIERLGGSPLSEKDRQTMLAVGVARVQIVLKGGG